MLDEAEREEFKAALDVCGPPPGRHHRGFGRGCDDDKGSSEAPAPDESTPEDTAPEAEGSSFAA